ncbi:MAG: alkaline phosphatase family protein [Acidobacteriaceae bacterium]
MAPPPAVTISASPASITAGASVTLTVTATNASSVKITGTDGSSYSLGASGGTQSVTPTATVTYTATAAALSGTASATATATVTVSAPVPPTVTISANPTAIAAGQSSTLTVIATNATGVTVTGSDGSTYTLTPTGGTQAVTPASTTTYTATATGTGGATITAQATVTVSATGTAPTVTMTANPSTIATGSSSTLTVTATNATGVTVTGSDGSSYPLSPTGGTQSVSPTATTTYTATATSAGGTTATAQVVVTVTPAGSEMAITHVIFMLQENHTFDNYFGMLNPYRQNNGWNIGADGNTYNVDGIDDKTNTISNKDDEGDVYPLFRFTSTCIDDETSAWLASYGETSTYDFTTTRPILMDGFVHNAEGYAKACVASGTCSGTFDDTTGRRAMGYYDQGFLNYYYYMASQFALSDRWFSPISSKTVDNRLAMYTGGTTQGLVKDPSADDHITTQLSIPTIFEELDQNNVSWKLYYTSTLGYCIADDGDECTGSSNANYPAIWYSYFQYSHQYLYENPSGAPCTGTTQSSTAVGDASGSFCIDTNHIAPLPFYYNDIKNGTLPSFAFIMSGSGINDEHPGSGQSILTGQYEVSKIINALMTSPSWSSSVFFFSYDEGGGPYEHVPPVPGHSNDFTDAADQSLYPDISSIAVNPDSYNPCLPAGGTPTLHCDLATGDPGASPDDAAAQQGFAAQLGFRVPNFVISPFARAHYVSHIPMDHTAIIKFVENRFIGSSAHLTNRDAAQPNLLDFFDFTGVPWATPPTPPAPNTTSGTCNPDNMGP